MPQLFAPKTPKDIQYFRCFCDFNLRQNIHRPLENQFLEVPEHKLYEGVLGIIVTYEQGVQAGCILRNYFGYYYDLEGDCELSVTEYLSAFSLNIDELMLQILGRAEYLSALSYVSDHSNVSFRDCILDGDGAIVVFTNLESIDERSKIYMGPLF